MPGIGDHYYVTGGTLRSDAPSYVVREADRQLLEGLRAGEFCYVLDARQMGKSSLMVRVAQRLRESHTRIVVLDLTAIGQNVTLEQWYYGLLQQAGEQIDAEDALTDFWRENKALGPMQRWIAALREVALTAVDTPLVVFVDEIDSVRSLPFSTDEFFASIRECYNRRTHDPRFQYLTFCLLGVATPADLIRDVRTTPFNIGRRIVLTDFTTEDTMPLAGGLSPEPGIAQRVLKRILYWTAGHPYLTQRLCRAVAECARPPSPHTVDALCNSLFLSLSARETDDNLQFVRSRILREETDRASLLDLYRRILLSRSGISLRHHDPLVDRLILTGITRAEGERLVVRNRIYRRVFDRGWIEAGMPDAERKRQQAAYRQGLIRTAAVSSVIVAAVGGLAFSAYRSAQDARSAAHAARKEAAAREQALIELKHERSVAWEARNSEHRQRLAAEAAADKLNDALRRVEAEKLRAHHLAQRERSQRQRADEQRMLAQTYVERSRRLRYVSDVALAQRELAQGNDARLEALLRPYLPGSGKARPGWEWRHLWWLSHRDRLALEGHRGSVHGVAFSHDGKLLATASDSYVRLWSATSGKLVRKWHIDGLSVAKIAFGADNRIVTVANQGGVHSLRGLSIDSGVVENILALPTPKDDRWAWDSRLRVVLTAEPQYRVRTASASSGPLRQTTWKLVLRDISRNGQETTLAEVQDPVYNVAVSPDGMRIATATDDGTVTFWNRSGKTATRTLQGEGHALRDMAFSADGAYFATAPIEKAARQGARVALWETTTGRRIAQLDTDNSRVSTLAFAPDGSILATGDSGGVVRLWTLAGTPVRTLKGHAATINHLAFSPDSNQLASSGDGGEVKIWAVRSEPEVQVLETHLRAINTVAVTPDNRLLITGGGDKTAKVWDLVSGEQVADLPGAHLGIASLAVSPDGRIVAVGSDDGTIRLWERATWRLMRTLKREYGWIKGLAFSPDGKTLGAACASENRVDLWNVATGRLVRSWEPERTDVWGIAFSPDGRTLITGGLEGDVRVWSLPSGRLLRRLRGHAGKVFTVAYSPGGRLIASGSADRSAILWDAVTGKMLYRLEGHRYPVRSVAFSPDGMTLVTGAGGNERVIRLWNVATGQQIQELPVLERGGVSIVFSPDGRMLVAGSATNAVHVWRAATFDDMGFGHTAR